jgi:hypothetical protein
MDFESMVDFMVKYGGAALGELLSDRAFGKHLEGS